MTHTPALYVHFPWCVRKCPYCDFNSHPLKGDLEEQAYLDALLRDLDAQRNPQPTTVFFGGGTPSLFSPDAFAQLLTKIGEADEVTMEANPGTTEHANFSAYRQAGINRLSLGAQSFDDAQLTRLGRIHNAKETVQAFEQARAGGLTNINVDVMYGLPDQTVDDAMSDLDQALALSPEHISWYQLTLEPKTEFYKRPPALPSDPTIEQIEVQGHAKMAEHGYARYEVSAWSRDGYACLHNLSYWRFLDYTGIGAGAHGKHTQLSGILRTTQQSQPRLYLANPTKQQRTVVPREALALEVLMNVLRLIEGVSFEHFADVSQNAFPQIEAAWQQAVEDGLVRTDRIGTTPLGLRYLDGVLQRFLD